VLAVFQAIATVLAIRLQLLLALLGAFVLAIMAMRDPSYLALAVLLVYSGLTVIPLVWLAWPGKKTGVA
jgi:hypothetical protein